MDRLLGRLRFTCAHELGHWVLHQKLYLSLIHIFDQAHAFALEQGTFDQKVFYEAFGIFDNQSIEKSLVSQNPLVRIFALLDRRLGKRHQMCIRDRLCGGSWMPCQAMHSRKMPCWSSLNSCGCLLYTSRCV